MARLSRKEQLKIREFLASELAKQEDLANSEPEENYFEMLHNSEEGARQLAQFLEEQKQPQNA